MDEAVRTVIRRIGGEPHCRRFEHGSLAQALLQTAEMFSKTGLVIACAVVVTVTSVRGQSLVDPTTAGDLVSACTTYRASEFVFVGRAEAPVTFRISGESEIDEARQNFVKTQAEVAHVRASLEPRTFERDVELEFRILVAQVVLERRLNKYPPPWDLTLIPVRVEQAFRGATEPTLMVRLSDPSFTMESGEPYLISGYRSKGLLPPFPEMSRNPVEPGEYVDTVRVTPVASAQQELRLLASPVSSATIVGTLRMSSDGDGVADAQPGARLSGIRVVVSSGTHEVETTTRKDGSFTVSGLASGRLGITPVLPDDLTVVNRSSMALEVGEGGCKTVDLKVAANSP